MLVVDRVLIIELELLLHGGPWAGLAPLFVIRVFEIHKLRKKFAKTTILVGQKVKTALTVASKEYSSRRLDCGRGSRNRSRCEIKTNYVGKRVN